MPLYHREPTGDLVMYLYDRSQNHGNHNLSHFHITYKNENVVFDANGNKLAGNCEIENEISDYIKKHKNHIRRCLKKIVLGKPFSPQTDNIF